MRLELSRTAEADLDDIRDFSIREFERERAIAYVDAIEQVFRQMLAYPEIGAKLAGLPDVRSIPCQRHRIFYAIEGDRIVIQRILHQSMDITRRL